MPRVKNSPQNAIRQKCFDCCCGQSGEVSNCTVTGCPPHPSRMGKNPFRKKREYTEEQLAELRARMVATREKVGK